MRQTEEERQELKEGTDKFKQLFAFADLKSKSLLTRVFIYLLMTMFIFLIVLFHIIKNVIFLSWSKIPKQLRFMKSMELALKEVLNFN